MAGPPKKKVSSAWPFGGRTIESKEYFAPAPSKLELAAEKIWGLGKAHREMKLSARSIISSPALTEKQKINFLNALANIARKSPKLSKKQETRLQRALDWFEEEAIHEGRVKLKGMRR
ncbi:MAG: hypothetical protein V1494_04200 [Candidatus Diapherotrites archaeon]